MIQTIYQYRPYKSNFLVELIRSSSDSLQIDYMLVLVRTRFQLELRQLFGIVRLPALDAEVMGQKKANFVPRCNENSLVKLGTWRYNN